MRRRGDGTLERLVHVDGEPVAVRIAGPAAGRVVLAAAASRPSGAERAIARMRFALALDEDYRAFHDAFAADRLIGASVRARPWLRLPRRPDPFEALAWAICEQRIEYERAAAIERRIVARLGRPCRRTGLRDAPGPGELAAVSPALLESLGLAHRRALALARAAGDIAAGRVTLDGGEESRRRLGAITGIGAWTLEMLDTLGYGRHDRLPAADLTFRRAVGRHLSGGAGGRRPHPLASEAQVRELLAPYGEWRALAAWHLVG
jgi:3-methyladenine DNA glycosylase/8-oxoguanine DNA glycosylase